MNLIRIAGVALVGLAVLVETAFAESYGPVASAPGPIAGIGLPALILIGGTYWVGRKLFGQKK